MGSFFLNRQQNVGIIFTNIAQASVPIMKPCVAKAYIS